MDLKKKTIIINDTNICYYDNEHIDQKILFFSHGWGADKNNLAIIYNSLKDNYRIISIDLPGFGESSINNNIKESFDYAEILYKFCKKLDLKDINYIGHSFGGKIGIILSSQYKGLISKLVLIDSSGLKPKRGLNWYSKVYSFKILKFFYSMIITDKKKIEAFKNKFGSKDYRDSGSMRKILVKVVNENLEPIIHQIDIPVFIYWGEKDKDTPLWMARKLNKLIKDSGLYVVKRGGHFSFLDDTRIIYIIKSFIGE